MKKSEKVKLKDAMTQYLQLKELTDSQKKQMDALKEVVETIAEANPKEFVDGELCLEGIGLLKYVQNPAKIVYAASGKSLNEIETVGLATELDKIGIGFTKIALNVTKVRNLVEAKNGAVLSILSANGIELIQETRLDIKKA